MIRNTINSVQATVRRKYKTVISAVMCMALMLCVVPLLQLDVQAASTVITAGTLEELQNALAIAEGGDIIQLTARIYIPESTVIKAPKASADNPVVIYSKSSDYTRHFETLGASTDITLEFCNVVLDGGYVSGGIMASMPNVTIINAVIQNCKTNGFGGGINADYNNLTVFNSKIVSNAADFGGGGIYCGGVTNIISSEIIGNESITGDGGGICAVGSESKLSINNSIVSGNTADGIENGIYIEGYISAKNNSIEDNVIRYEGRGVYAQAELSA